MSLDDATVRRIGKLARLRLDDGEIGRLRGELAGILGWIEMLDEVDVTGITPLTGAATMALRLRDDVVTEGLTGAGLTGGGRAEAVLANAPDRAGMFYAVPKVVE